MFLSVNPYPTMSPPAAPFTDLQGIPVFAVPANTVATPADRTGSPGHPVRLAIAYARDLRRWAHLLRYDPDQRFAGLIDETDEHQAWVMTWLPGQHTDLHDHAGAAGAFTVVRGTLREYVAGTRSRTHDLVVGQSRVFGPGYAHQVSGVGEEPAVSVHVYRPVRSMRSLSE